jgi:glucose/arabinose dehydrogenase
LHPNFQENNLIYLYKTTEDEGMLKNKVVQYELENNQLRKSNIIIDDLPGAPYHDGGRIDFGPDNKLYVTAGDATNPEGAQNKNKLAGKILRLNPDGTIPQDNPFNNSVYSYGHRNPQGLTWLNNQLWVPEHGDVNKDELNLVQKGGNYGWPITHTGCEYGTDRPLAEDPQENPNVVNPVYYWECGTGGFAPSGMTFYSGDNDWDGDLFVGNLAGKELGHFSIDRSGNTVEVTEEASLLDEQSWRIRDVEQIGDSLYIITDSSDGLLVRINP